MKTITVHFDPSKVQCSAEWQIGDNKVRAGIEAQDIVFEGHSDYFKCRLSNHCSIRLYTVKRKGGTWYARRDEQAIYTNCHVYIPCKDISCGGTTAEETALKMLNMLFLLEPKSFVNISFRDDDIFIYGMDNFGDHPAYCYNIVDANTDRLMGVSDYISDARTIASCLSCRADRNIRVYHINRKTCERDREVAV